MPEDKKSVWNSGQFDELEYLTHTEKEDTVKPKFINDEPEINVNKFKSTSYDFEVLDTVKDTMKTYSVTSKRLMKTLESFTPLSGKTLSIKRIGSGMDTDYNVKELK